MFDRKKAEDVFRNYAAAYDAADPKIALKIKHTFRVAELSERIAESLALDEADRDLAWFLGLLHDIGRFEQVRRYGTFFDRDSVDHAELGADILFSDRLIDSFPHDGLPEGWEETAETAIRCHNKLKLPEGLDERTKRFCCILRDGDKADIFRVICEVPFAQRAGRSLAGLKQAEAASDEVMAFVYRHVCVPRAYVHTEFEANISHCCMAFELVFEETVRIVWEQGYLAAMLGETGETALQKQQMEELRSELRIAGICV